MKACGENLLQLKGSLGLKAAAARPVHSRNKSKRAIASVFHRNRPSASAPGMANVSGQNHSLSRHGKSTHYQLLPRRLTMKCQKKSQGELLQNDIIETGVRLRICKNSN